MIDFSLLKYLRNYVEYLLNFIMQGLLNFKNAFIQHVCNALVRNFNFRTLSFPLRKNIKILFISKS